MQDDRAMRLALKLAAEARGNTSPNPLVGALVVSADEIVGRGFHARAGSAHAEALALHEAGPRARNSTLYVTLEPCVHQGQTPPCVEAVIAAQPARVVVAIEDPDVRVSGRGIAALRNAGIAVDVGVARDEAARLNRMYIHQRRTGLPFVTLKMAQSLDGKIGGQPGERLQLSGKRAQRHVRLLRFEHDAIMVGAGTVAIDDPQLTVRPYKRRHVAYTRIIVDAHGRISPRAKALRDQSRARTIVITTDQMPASLKHELQRREIRLIECARDDNGLVDLGDALRRLNAIEIASILCEGGPRLAASLLSAGLVCELQWLVAPVAFGGEAVDVVAKLEPFVRFEIEQVRRLGEDVVLGARMRPADHDQGAQRI